MATEVILPRVDMDMAEGRISRWYVEEGASVAKGQPIFEIETDKAAMEVEAPASGVIRNLSADLDTALPVGSVIAWIEAEGGTSESGASNLSSLAERGRATAGVADLRTSEARRQAGGLGPPLPASGERNCPAQLRATPLARRLARERGIDLAALAGTGPKGRIHAADIEARNSTPVATPAVAEAQGEALHRQWLRRGEGLPLVLLHGFGADLNAWRLFLATARLTSPVVGIDLPGHGGSADRRISGFADMVDAVAGTLRQEGLGAVHLMGHSLGGAVAAALAGSGGIEARSLFLVAPAGLGPDMNGAFVSGFLRARSTASLKPWMEELVADPATLGPSFIEATLRQRQAPPAADGLTAVAAALFPEGTQAFSVRGAFERLAIPAKIVVGAEDRIIPARHAQGLPGKVAIHMFRGVGHMPHVEAREDVAALLRELLRAA